MMEFRVVCKHHPKDGHQLHRWDKGSRGLAEQSILDLNHAAEIKRDNFYSKCAPYTLETREVSEWTEAVE